MTLLRHNPKRDTSEPSIVKALEQLGCDVFRLNQPVDLLIGYRGHTYLAECKTGKAKPTGEQERFITQWRGGRPAVLHTADDAIKFIGSLP